MGLRFNDPVTGAPNSGAPVIGPTYLTAPALKTFVPPRPVVKVDEAFKNRTCINAGPAQKTSVLKDTEIPVKSISYFVKNDFSQCHNISEIGKIVDENHEKTPKFKTAV